MGWLNYHHLYYFWTVAREGTVARAAAHLRLTEPTVSSQVHQLERSLGEKLFRREGRTLALTDAGRLAQRYASDIFTLGKEFQAAIAGARSEGPARLLVGIADVVPRLIAYRILEPAVRGRSGMSVNCQNDAPERLLLKLVAHELDLVISDAPLDARGKVRTHSQLLGECGVTIFATHDVVARYRRDFPRSLHERPFLLPAEGTALRRSLDAWFLASGIRPAIRGEFTDSALLKAFGRAAIGAFAAPSAIEAEVMREYRVRRVGRVDAIRERFYAVSTHRKLQHPAVAMITHAARNRLFG